MASAAPLPVLLAVGGWYYLASHGLAMQTAWLALNLLDTFRALRLSRPNGRRIGLLTRRKAMRDSLVGWMVYVAAQLFGPPLDRLLSWLPLYSPIKVILSLSFLLVRAAASSTIYTSLLAPTIKRYETPIDLTLLLLHSLTVLLLHYAFFLPLDLLASIPSLPLSAARRLLASLNPRKTTLPPHSASEEPDVDLDSLPTESSISPGPSSSSSASQKPRRSKTASPPKVTISGPSAPPAVVPVPLPASRTQVRPTTPPRPSPAASTERLAAPPVEFIPRRSPRKKHVSTTTALALSSLPSVRDLPLPSSSVSTRPSFKSVNIPTSSGPVDKKGSSKPAASSAATASVKSAATLKKSVTAVTLGGALARHSSSTAAPSASSRAARLAGTKGTIPRSTSTTSVLSQQPSRPIARSKTHSLYPKLPSVQHLSQAQDVKGVLENEVAERGQGMTAAQRSKSARELARVRKPATGTGAAGEAGKVKQVEKEGREKVGEKRSMAMQKGEVEKVVKRKKLDVRQDR